MIKVALFFMSLSLLIILHEFGHFITARLFKMRVNKFYLFFDFLFPLANVAKFSLFKKKVGQTEYGIGWFPFGGYVDIHGMQAEENADPNEVPAPDEFRGKKPWQRLIVLAGGVTVNYLLAITIYSMVFWTQGEDHLPTQNVKYGVYFDSMLVAQGFQNGDKILALDHKPVVNFDEVPKQILLDGPSSITVERNGEKKEVAIDPNFAWSAIANDLKSLMSEQIPFVVDSVLPDLGAMKAGIKKGDSLIAINSDTLPYFQQYQEALSHHKKGNVNLTFIRDGKMQTLSVAVNEDGMIGVTHMDEERYLTLSHVDYSFFPAWKRGFTGTWEKLTDYVRQMKFLFSKAGVKKLGGFATIGSYFPASWDWVAFWKLTAFLSVVLAFMNLLPIPALDGGYILFVLWEMFTGKKVSDKFMNRALTIGMYFILALLIYANGNDILRAFSK